MESYWKDKALEKLGEMKSRPYQEVDELYRDVAALNIPEKIKRDSLGLLLSRGVFLAPVAGTGWAHFSPKDAIDSVIEKIRNYEES